MDKTMNASRRAFLQKAASLSVAGVATPWALNLAALSEASAATATDYKAIVCVFLYGGNDYGNTLVPYDTTGYNAYYNLRPTLAYARDALTPTALKVATDPRDSAGFPHQYALAPNLAPLLPLFDAGKLAPVLNVGTLIQPTTKAQYQAKSVKLPPKLFSHNDQQSVWQSSAPEGARSGWGGRMGDLFQSGNANTTFTCVNVTGNAVFLSGNTSVQYQVTTSGSVPFSGLQSNLFGSAACSTALRTLITQNRSHLLEAEYNRVTQRAIDANVTLSAALASAPAFQTVYPAKNSLGDQLKLVAKMIATADTLKVKRQVFFVGIGGFDTHDGLVSNHPVLMKTVADAMAAFYNTTVELRRVGAVLGEIL